MFINIKDKLKNESPPQLYKFYNHVIVSEKCIMLNDALNSAMSLLLTSLTLLINKYMDISKHDYEHLYKLIFLMSEKQEWNQKTVVDRLFNTTEKIEPDNYINKIYQLFLSQTYNMDNYVLVISSLLSIFTEMILNEYKTNKICDIHFNSLLDNLIETDKAILRKNGF